MSERIFTDTILRLSAVDPSDKEATLYIIRRALDDAAEQERNRFAKIELALRRWVDMQSGENAHALYQAAIDHFCLTPVLPD